MRETQETEGKLIPISRSRLRPKKDFKGFAGSANSIMDSSFAFNTDHTKNIADKRFPSFSNMI